jgi:uncharacterized protein YndB with AHSA1/START domain
MSTPSTDRIEKKIHLRAQRSRVWRALTDAREFGQWFGVEMKGSFAVGERLLGKITTPGYDHLTLTLTVERMELERLLSYRWHPYAIDPKVDYASEPTTLVELRLEEVPGGTELIVVESGFDAIPAARRAEAYRMNEGGWAAQMENVRRHVEG